MNNPMKKLLAVAIWMGATSAGAMADVPRTLASGAPACGNTNGKAPSACERAERQLEGAKARLTAALATERAAIALVSSQPRRLPNGAPACGNTGGKLPTCTAERADDQFERRMRHAAMTTEQVRKARAAVHEATRRYAASVKPPSGIADDVTALASSK